MREQETTVQRSISSKRCQMRRQNTLILKFLENGRYQIFYVETISQYGYIELKCNEYLKSTTLSYLALTGSSEMPYYVHYWKPKFLHQSFILWILVYIPLQLLHVVSLAIRMQEQEFRVHSQNMFALLTVGSIVNVETKEILQLHTHSPIKPKKMQAVISS